MGLSVVLENKKEVNYNVAIAVSKILLRQIIQVGIFCSVIYFSIIQMIEYNNSLMIPMKIKSNDQIEKTRVKNALMLLSCPVDKSEKLTESIIHGANVANVDPVLIAVLMQTESNFKPNAKSSMGFKGLLQTPNKTGYSTTDTVYGCDILKEKLKENNGNLHAALTNYKGSKFVKGSVGYKQAQEVLVKYNEIKKRV